MTDDAKNHDKNFATSGEVDLTQYPLVVPVARPTTKVVEERAKYIDFPRLSFALTSTALVVIYLIFSFPAPHNFARSAVWTVLIGCGQLLGSLIMGLWAFSANRPPGQRYIRTEAGWAIAFSLATILVMQVMVLHSLAGLQGRKLELYRVQVLLEPVR